MKVDTMAIVVRRGRKKVERSIRAAFWRMESEAGSECEAIVGDGLKSGKERG